MNVADIQAIHLAPSSRVGPDKTALVFGERRVSYAQLARRSTQLAAWLRVRGVGKGDRVAALLYNCPEYFELYFGCALLGALLVPINFRLAAPEVARVLADAEPTILVHGPEFAALVAQVRPQSHSVRHVLLLGGADDAYEAALATAPTEGFRPESVAGADDLMILYSSGTTGMPKGAVWSHDNALWFAASQIAEFGFDTNDVTLIVCPLYNCGGLAEWSIPTLLRGGTCVILPSRGFSARTLLTTVQREHVTVTLFLPVMLYDILEVPDLASFDTSSLRLAVCGGEPMPLAMHDRVMAAFPHVAYGEGYGLTEGTPIATFVRPQHMARKKGSVGQPMLGVEVRVVDDAGTPVPPGATGEVTIRGPVVCGRYWRNPELSARTFRDGFCFSGDLGHLDDEGYLYLTGRKKDMIISGGENVYPAEVEDALAAHPAVLEAAVIGIPHPRWGETVLAVVAARPDHLVTPDDLLAWCAARLAGYKRPRRIELLDRLPRSAMHKVLKDDLRARFTQPDSRQHVP